MSKKRSSSARGFEKSFSRQFDSAMIETRLIDALVKADGWTLAAYAAAPLWIQELYNRHADAAHREMLEIEKAEGVIKPSEHR